MVTTDILRNCPAPVGIDRLDEQRLELHRQLWGLLNILEKNPSGAIPENRFIQFADQTTEHYRTEEEFMQTMGFPDLASHRIEHERIVRRFKENMMRWNAPNSPSLVALVGEFAESTLKHSKMMDFAFVKWLGERAGRSFPGAD
jgi:hemerythrin-like metal-binding protein